MECDATFINHQEIYNNVFFFLATRPDVERKQRETPPSGAKKKNQQQTNARAQSQSGVPLPPETISRRRARLEDHLTKCKPFSTRREGGDDGSGEKLTTREEEDPAEFWGELLFFDHDRGAALDAASSGPVVSKSGGGDRGVEGNGDGDGFKGGVGNGNGDVEAEGSREGKSGKGDGSATAATATFDAAFTSAAEKEAKAEEDLFDEDTVEEVIDMDAHPGFVKPAFDVDDCEPDCDDSEDGLNKKSGTA